MRFLLLGGYYYTVVNNTGNTVVKDFIVFRDESENSNIFCTFLFKMPHFCLQIVNRMLVHSIEWIGRHLQLMKCKVMTRCCSFYAQGTNQFPPPLLFKDENTVCLKLFTASP